MPNNCINEHPTKPLHRLRLGLSMHVGASLSKAEQPSAASLKIHHFEKFPLTISSSF